MTPSETAALAVSAAGVIAGVVTFVGMRRISSALAATLELWTAAGLLRLTADATWKAVAIAATLVLIRKLVVSTAWRRRTLAAHR